MNQFTSHMITAHGRFAPEHITHICWKRLVRLVTREETKFGDGNRRKRNFRLVKPQAVRQNLAILAVTSAFGFGFASELSCLPTYRTLVPGIILLTVCAHDARKRKDKGGEQEKQTQEQLLKTPGTIYIWSTSTYLDLVSVTK